MIQNSSGTLALVKTGNGTQVLSGINTYRGATTVNAGVLAAGAANALSALSSVNVTGGTLDASNSPQSVYSLSVGAAGAVNLAIGNLLTTNSGSTDSFGGTLNLSGNAAAGAELISYGGYSGGFATVDLNGSPLPTSQLVYGANAHGVDGRVQRNGRLGHDQRQLERRSVEHAQRAQRPRPGGGPEQRGIAPGERGARRAGNGRHAGVGQLGRIDHLRIQRLGGRSQRLDARQQRQHVADSGSGGRTRDFDGHHPGRQPECGAHGHIDAHARRRHQRERDGLGLSLNDAGTLILSGSNGYTGGTNVNAGTLLVENPDGIPNGSSLTVGAGAASLFASPAAGGVVLGGAGSGSGRRQFCRGACGGARAWRSWR